MCKINRLGIVEAPPTNTTDMRGSEVTMSVKFYIPAKSIFYVEVLVSAGRDMKCPITYCLADLISYVF